MSSRSLSTWRCSVTSCAVPSIDTASPSRWTTRPRPRTIRSSPSGRMMRCSNANGPAAGGRLAHGLLGEPTIVGMDELEVALVGEGLQRLPLEPEDAVKLVRPARRRRAGRPTPSCRCGRGPAPRAAARRVRASALGRGLALGERRAEDEQADDHDGERGLGKLHPLGRRLSPERHGPVDGSPGADRADQEGRGGGADLLEAERRPEQEREDQVRVPPRSGEEHDRAHGDERGEQRDALEETGACGGPSLRGGVVEDEQDGRDDQDPHRVAEPPEQPRRAVGVLPLRRRA